MVDHHISIALVAIVALGVASQWVAWRTRIPAIILLSTAGLLAGPVFGYIDPGETFGNALRPIISLCVAIILFEGGLSLHFSELKVAAVGVRRLVWAGAPLAWLFGSLAAWFIGGLSVPVALLFGAIMVVTGPTVIMPLLRQSGLNRRSASYLKWEGIINDPIGALLAVLVVQFFFYAESGAGLTSVFSGLAWALLSGTVLGGVGGYVTGKAFQHGLVPEFLKSPVMLSLVLLVFVASNHLQHEAGLLSVTIMGIVVGNMNLPGLEDMKRFKEYITVMLVSAVFILLTANLDIGALQVLELRGIALVAAVLFIVRPLTIFLATLGSDMDWRNRVLLGWIAPRGIVAAATAGVFGPDMVELGFEDGRSLLPLVFAVIFATVLLHGLSIGALARTLGLGASDKNGVIIVGASPWSIELARTLQSLNVHVLVVDTSWHNLRPARLAGIPVFYGEILSDFAEESVEMARIGTVLAATSNDAYNALVCNAMGPELGRGNVYQLPMGSSEEDDPRAVARSLRGRIAFTQEALFERLWRYHVGGWVFTKTGLTDNYSYSDFLGDTPSEVIQILVLKPGGEVHFQSQQSPLEPEAGDTIVCFGPERGPARAEAPGTVGEQPA